MEYVQCKLLKDNCYVFCFVFTLIFQMFLLFTAVLIAEFQIKIHFSDFIVDISKVFQVGILSKRKVKQNVIFSHFIENVHILNVFVICQQHFFLKIGAQWQQKTEGLTNAVWISCRYLTPIKVAVVVTWSSVWPSKNRSPTTKLVVLDGVTGSITFTQASPDPFTPVTCA